jgi:wyosine [tRNA(Phe)-imidazoG37] synthetase (radical SAM superfamily)
MKFIFGPINSRRFGISLGIDLSPNFKQCNFDCVYCELNGAKTMQKQQISNKSDDILSEIKQALNDNVKIDVLTITANGEPTLYPFLGKLIDGINALKPQFNNFKTLILSNSGKIMEQKTRDVLTKFDIVKLSLDCVSKKCFRKLDRINKNINALEIMQGIKDFRKVYKKELVLEVLFVKNINDNESEINLLKKTINDIKPNRVDINTIDRPPAYDYKGLNEYELIEIVKKFDTLKCKVVVTKPKNLLNDKNITTATINKSKKKAKLNEISNKKNKSKYFSKSDILHTLKRRPLSTYDIEVLFDELSKNNLKELEQKGNIKRKETNKQVFFVLE